MKCFAFLTATDSLGLPDHLLSRYEALPRLRGWEYVWQRFGDAAVLSAWDHVWGDPLVAREGDHVAAGTVRLDNRNEVGGWSGLDRVDWECLTDLELVLRVIATTGARRMPNILGDFAFVTWHAPTRSAVAMVDAFAVKKLYFASHASHFAFASRAELLALEERYNIEYLTRLVALHPVPRNATVYLGVQPVPAASTCVMTGRAWRTTPYWSLDDLDIEYGWEAQETEAVACCRELLAESVRQRLGDDGRTWAQLSGGLDSSSVASVAQWLHECGKVPHGLAGTVTQVYREGSGADERSYSDAVVERWRVRNEVLVDEAVWFESEQPVALTDQPVASLDLNPRDQQVAAVVRSTGGQVLLTGWGGDELFSGSLLFFADRMMPGRFSETLCEMAHYAAVGRVSFWELAYKNVAVPLMPSRLRRQLLDQGKLPQPWLNKDLLRHYRLEGRSVYESEYEGTGSRYKRAVFARIGRLEQIAARGNLSDLLDLRHPMMYRPLVEFAARLPPGLRSRPHAQRWVLRAAMRDILPSRVRTRVGKQDTGEAVTWQMTRARKLLSPLLDAPILGDLGIVDPAPLRAALSPTAPAVVSSQLAHVPVLTTLAIEAWLQMRSGRWPRGAAFSRAAVPRNKGNDLEPASFTAGQPRRVI